MWHNRNRIQNALLASTRLKRPSGGTVTLRVKKAKKYRPGTVALRKLKRQFKEEGPTQQDQDYKTTCKLDMTVDRIRTRYTERTCTRIADNITVLDADHGPEDEAAQFYDFKGQLEQSSFVNRPEKVGTTWMIESPNAIWCCRFVRYTGRVMREIAILENKPIREFLSTYTGCQSTVSRDVRGVITRGKPICILVGGQVQRKKTGHCVTLVIWETEQGRRAWVKETLPIGETKMRNVIFDILKPLHVPYVTLVGELVSEQDITYTECLKESYRVVGQVLDGVFFWDRRLVGFTKTYNVNRKKEVFMTMK